MTSRAYFWWIVGGTLALLLPVVVLNLLLIANDQRFDKNRLASQWQQETRGITYAPPINNNRAFKTLRLHDQLGDINALVFGSSTAMSITADAFPNDVRAYNFAQSGNSLLSVLGEADYVLGHWGDRIRLLLIPLDWALGSVHQPGGPVPAALAPEHVTSAPPPSLIASLREALSLPRVRDLGRIFRDVSVAADPLAAARHFFREPGGGPYRCSDGALARDYDTLFRGMCVGFRYDGSATFADQKRVTVNGASSVLAQAASASSQYAAALSQKSGAPDVILLAALAAVVDKARERGVRVILYMPPLLPGLDARLAASTHSGSHLLQTKSVLRTWSQRNQVALFDAGPSEGFGCVSTEFIDAHHALPECYRKVITQIFAGQARLP